MEKREQQARSGYDYDDQGIMQVNQQIMDSYNSGIMGQDQMKSIKEEKEEQQ